MNKPITVKYQEFKDKLAEVINDSELPPFVIEPVLKEYLNETHAFAEQQYQKDKLSYEDYLSDCAKAVSICVEAETAMTNG